MKTMKVHRFNYLHRSVAAFALLLAPPAAQAATLHGSSDAQVVWVSAPDAIPAPTTVEMHNKDRSFIPDLVVIAQGSSVRFPNDDSFFHSIYSDAKPDEFDIGFYGPGPGKTVDFRNPGIVDVHCHIHASMHGTIVVTDGPFALVSNGAYTIANVPPGKRTVHSWSLQNGEKTTTVDITNDTILRI